MKKISLFISLFLIIFVSCEDSQAKIIEPKVTKNSVEYPFESIKNGKFITIYRNNTSETIPITFVMAKVNEIIPNSQDYDFCPDIIKLRNGIVNPDWFIVNFNQPIVSEASILNKNDHANQISYSLPLGTYMGTVMDAEGCNKEQYGVFDVTTNDGLQPAQTIN